MSGGGSGGGETTSYSSTLPEYAKPYYEQLMQSAGKEIFKTDADGKVIGVQSYTPYGGDRVAGLNSYQTGAASTLAGMNTPAQFKAAQSGMMGAQTMGANAAKTGFQDAFSYDAAPLQRLGMSTPQTFDAQAAAQYTNPFQQNVTNNAIESAMDAAAARRNDAALGSIGRGTFGGARQALIQSEQDHNLYNSIGDIQAKGSLAGWENAQQQFERDRMAGMTAQSQNLQAEMDRRRLEEQGRQFEAGIGKDIGLAGLSTQLGASTALQGLGDAQRADELRRLQMQLGMGSMYQNASQAEMDQKYQDFMEKQNFGKSELEWLSNILRGNASALGTTRTDYTPTNTAAQIGGLGLAGLSAYNKMGT